MNQSKRKKIILGIVLAGTFTLAGLHTAGARPMGGGYNGCDCTQQFNNNCGGYGIQQGRQLDEKSQAAYDTFRSETSVLRKEIAVKRAEKRALMRNENPDSDRISQLTGELFDLREQMHTKAQNSGIQTAGMRGQGYGHGCNGSGGFQKPF